MQATSKKALYTMVVTYSVWCPLYADASVDPERGLKAYGKQEIKKAAAAAKNFWSPPPFTMEVSRPQIEAAMAKLTTILNDGRKPPHVSAVEAAKSIVEIRKLCDDHINDLVGDTDNGYIQELNKGQQGFGAMINNPDPRSVAILAQAAQKHPGIKGTLANMWTLIDNKVKAETTQGAVNILTGQQNSPLTNICAGLQILRSGSLEKALAVSAHDSLKFGLNVVRAFVIQFFGSNELNVAPKSAGDRREDLKQLLHEWRDGVAEISKWMKSGTDLTITEFSNGKFKTAKPATIAPLRVSQGDSSPSVPCKLNAEVKPESKEVMAVSEADSASKIVSNGQESHDKKNGDKPKKNQFDVAKFMHLCRQRAGLEQVNLIHTAGYSVAAVTAFLVIMRNQQGIRNAIAKSIMMTLRGSKWLATKWVDGVEWTLKQGLRGVHAMYTYATASKQEAVDAAPHADAELHDDVKVVA